ncbi:MAG: sterol carrier family protein [Bifidobacteriaceae bacterium]|jgi:hypothetical protein|nr:sterol carrier family protein [Bifidobacteriaceae bacterium]
MLALPSQTTSLILASLGYLRSHFPGQAIEVRIPPIGAVQCFSGVRHTRGTPPNVFQTDAQTWLKLIRGTKSFDELAPLIDYSGSEIYRLIEQLPLNEDFFKSFTEQ